MAAIKISRNHAIGSKDAHRKVTRIAKGIAERFQVKTEWDEHVLFFSRPGVNGRIVVDPDRILVEAEISFFLLPIRSAIESEINRHLDVEFGEA